MRLKSRLSNLLFSCRCRNCDTGFAIANPRNCEECLRKAALTAYIGSHNCEACFPRKSDKNIVNAKLLRPRSTSQLQPRHRNCDTCDPPAKVAIATLVFANRHRRHQHTSSSDSVQTILWHVRNSSEPLGLQIKHPHKSKNIIELARAIKTKHKNNI